MKHDDLIARLRFEADAEEHFGDGINVSIMREAADALEAITITDEAAERAARGIHASRDRGEHFEDELPEVQAEYRDMWRAALVAAIEGDE